MNSNPSSPPKSTLSSRSLAMKRLFRITVSSSERDVLVQFLKDAETETRGYETEINKLKAAVVSLENKRDRLKKTMAKHRSLLSAIHKLPPEILREIFAFFCEENLLELSSTSSALFLSQVCGRWREIALSMPSLWSSVSINLGDWKSDDCHRLRTVTQLFMGRSKTSPLSLAIDFDCQEGLEDEAVPVLDTLVAHSSRWQRVALQGVRGALRHPVFAPIKGVLPILTHLELTGGTEDKNFEHSSDLFSVCPSLTSLIIEPSCPVGLNWDIPWQQIRNLELQSAFSNGLSFIHCCHNIRELNTTYIGGRTYNDDHCILSSTTKLTIMASGQGEVSSVLHNCTLPQLASMEIRGGKPQPLQSWKIWAAKPLSDFLLRSSCHLTSLAFEWVPLSDEQAIDLLYSIPSLETLQIMEYRSTDDQAQNRIVTPTFLKELWVGNDWAVTPLLPKLHSLKLDVHGLSFDDKALVRAVTSRWLPDPECASEGGIDCIRSVDVVFLEDGEHVERLHASLRWMGDAGAQVRIVARLPGEDE
uniref:F-box domain-containing protein n=1 Tax=Moniliophthora roreri TaxID=221103 RepID=A0A0W0G6A0_MONRR